MNAFAYLTAADALVGRGRLVLNLLAQGLGVFVS